MVEGKLAKNDSTQGGVDDEREKQAFVVEVVFQHLSECLSACLSLCPPSHACLCGLTWVSGCVGVAEVM